MAQFTGLSRWCLYLNPSSPQRLAQFFHTPAYLVFDGMYFLGMINQINFPNSPYQQFSHSLAQDRERESSCECDAYDLYIGL